jgi:hypothetical protein
VVLENKLEEVVNPESDIAVEQAGSSNEEGTAVTIQKIDSSKMSEKPDHTTRFDSKKEAALKDSSQTSKAMKTPNRNVKFTMSYEDASEDSDIKSVSVHKFVAVYSDQLEGLTYDEAHQSIEKEGNFTVIVDAISELEKEDIFLTLLGKKPANDQQILIRRNSSFVCSFL